MDTDFEINVNYKGNNHVFKADYLETGYSYKINVELNGQLISFEPDEERNFRAVLDYENATDTDKSDRKLVEEIAKELMRLFK